MVWIFEIQPFVHQGRSGPCCHITREIPFRKTLVHDKVNETPSGNHEGREPHELVFVDAAIGADQILDVYLVGVIALEVPDDQGSDHYDQDQHNVHAVAGLHAVQ